MASWKVSALLALTLVALVSTLISVSAAVEEEGDLLDENMIDKKASHSSPLNNDMWNDLSLMTEKEQQVKGHSALSSQLISSVAMPAIMMLIANIFRDEPSKSGTAASGGARPKRSVTSAWSEQFKKILGNVQKAIDTFQKFEEEFSNDIDQNRRASSIFGDHD